MGVASVAASAPLASGASSFLINTGLHAGVHPHSAHLSRFNGFRMLTTRAQRSTDIGFEVKPLKRFIATSRGETTGLKAGVNGKSLTFILCLLERERRSCPAADATNTALNVVAPQSIGEGRDISGSDTFGRHDIRNAIWRR